MPDRENSGSLSRNQKKDASHPQWPDYQGSIDVGGVGYWISGWIKDGKDGGKFLSLSVRPKEERVSAPASREPSPEADSMPF